MPPKERKDANCWLMKSEPEEVSIDDALALKVGDVNAAHGALHTAHDAGVDAPVEVTPEAVWHTGAAHLARQGIRLAELASALSALSPQQTGSQKTHNSQSCDKFGPSCYIRWRPAGNTLKDPSGEVGAVVNLAV